MRIERAWKTTAKNGGGEEKAKTIDAETANREMANAHGANAVEKLEKEKTLETRFAIYRAVE